MINTAYPATGPQTSPNEPIRLSVCIPTYNFGAFIGETLKSITANLCCGTEVCILDGGSTDNTADVVASWQSRFPQISYHKRSTRGGIDRDIARAVDISSGAYCWLFSADDIMRPGAIARVLEEMKTECDVYLCEHTLCDADLRPIHDHPIFKRTRKPITFDLGNPAQRLAYFRDARTSEAFFSYLAGPIFKRAVWDAAGSIPDSFYSTCWALAGRLLSRVPSGLVVHYTGLQLVYKRSGVDSFMDRGIVNRMRITVEGFAHIAETIFGRDSRETFHIRRVTRHEAAFRLRRLLSVKMIVAASAPEDTGALNRLVWIHYSNAGVGNWLLFVVFRAAPVALLNKLKSIKDRLLSVRM